MVAANETSADAAVAAVLSGLGGIFLIKEKQRTALNVLARI